MKSGLKGGGEKKLGAAPHGAAISAFATNSDFLEQLEI
jgi:hypothetical protein